MDLRRVELRETPGWGSSRGGGHVLYEVVDGVLRPIGEVRRVYSASEHPEVVCEIAKLHEGDEKRLVTFAQTWGSLGYLGDPREGDPLPWVWAHVRNIRMVLDLHFYLQSGDSEGLGRFLDSHRGPSAVSASAEDSVLLPIGAPSGILQQELRLGAVSTDTARDIIAAIINPNLEELKYRVVADDEGEGLRPVLVFPSLAVAVYWHLANIVGGFHPLARCQECGAFFVQTDPRQRFCPPLLGQAGSLCGARFRKRRERQRKGG